VFALLRTSLDGNTNTLCLTNVTNKTIELSIDTDQWPQLEKSCFTDTLTEIEYAITEGTLKIMIVPYQVLWLQSI
jgi:hypothetical protein